MKFGARSETEQRLHVEVANQHVHGRLAMFTKIYTFTVNIFLHWHLNQGLAEQVDQMSKDVSAFLVWTAEPKLEERNQTGWAVIGFLILLTILAYMSYRTIWADVKAEKKKPE